jgi:hypothetical protein
MAKSSMHAKLRASPEIPFTHIAGDTCGFGKSGIEPKRLDGMLGGTLETARGTLLMKAWTNHGRK